MAIAVPPITRKAKAPPAIGRASFFLAGLAAAVVTAGVEGFALRSTIGLGFELTGDAAAVVWVVVVVVDAIAGAAVRVTVRLTDRAATGMALAGDTRLAVFTVLVAVVRVTVGAA